MSYNVLLEDILVESGGCGRYQWILGLIVHTVKITMSWSMLTMTFTGQDPGFWCINRGNGSAGNDVNYTSKDNCKAFNSSTCASFEYGDEMHTLVSEFDLVCDREWIVAMITTIQMAGVLVGCFVAGQFADTVGRKPTFFISIAVLIIFNVVAIFCPSWEWYAAVRFVIGIGIGFFLTVQYNLMLEFIVERWRARAVAVPSWSVEAAAFALVAWVFHDWKYVHIACAVVVAPYLLTWWFVPESFRWLITKHRYEAADRVVQSVSRMNKRDMPDFAKVIAMAKDDAANQQSDDKKTYTVVDVFRYDGKVTIGLLFIWMSISYAYYGLTFGIQNLSGNLYLNMFIVNIVEAPASFMMMYFANRFGRKRSCMVAFLLTGVCGVANGLLQYIDTSINAELTNAFAYFSKLTIACGWGALVVLTTEMYPTVVRSIAYGLHNTSARVGGMVAPQIVFLNESVPGLLFFLSGGLMFASFLICFIFPETMGRVLEDTFTTKTVNVDSKKNGEAVVDTKF